MARGRKPDVFACGVCHRADGSGGPENANVRGLPAEYIVQQMLAYKSGARQSSGNSVRMSMRTELTAENAEAAEIQINSSQRSLRSRR